MNKITRIISTVLAVILICACIPSSVFAIEKTYELGAAGRIYYGESKRLSAGVMYNTYYGESETYGKQRVMTLELQNNYGSHIAAVNLGKYVLGRDTVLAGALTYGENEQVVAAVNADFFSTAVGIPLGIFVENGYLLSSSAGNNAIGFFDDGESIIGTPLDSISILNLDGNFEYGVNHVNKLPSVFGAYLVTPAFSAKTQSYENSVEYVIETESELVFGGTISGTVTEIREANEDNPMQENKMVLCVPNAWEKSSEYKTMAVGDRLEISVSVSDEWKDVKYAVGGGDVLLDGGAVPNSVGDEYIEYTAQPRTAIGIKADGGAVLICVDGRQADYSYGVKLKELCEILKNLGCVNALNFDGGGSTTLAVLDAGELVLANKPSDTSMRKVSNAIMLVDGDDFDMPQVDITPFDGYILAGAEYVFPVSVIGGQTLKEKNTDISVSGGIGDAELDDDGNIRFVAAAETDGCGRMEITTEIDGKKVSTAILVNVTTKTDGVAFPYSILMAGENSEFEFAPLGAEYEGRTVYYGDTFTAEYIGDEGISITADGGKIKVTGTKGSGKIAITIGKMTDEIGVIFSDNFAYEIASGKTLAANLDIKLTGYDEEIKAAYLKDGGILKSSIIEVTTAQKGELPTETTTVTTDEKSSDTSATDTSASDTSASETTASDTTASETTASDTTASDTSAGETVSSETVSDTTAGTGETESGDEEKEYSYGVEVDLKNEFSSPYGIAGNKIWVWTKNITEQMKPCAKIVAKDADGEEITVSFEYKTVIDMSEENGWSLMCADLSHENISDSKIKTPLTYTVTDKEVHKTAFAEIYLEKNAKAEFTDLETSWAKNYINTIYYKGLAGGSLDGATGALVYIPSGLLTRQEFAKLIVNYLKIDIEQYIDTELDFVDADEIDTWALPYVKAAHGAGVMNGKPLDDKFVFAPREKITRQETMFVLGGMIEMSDEELEKVTLEFKDADKIGAWALDNIKRAYAAGIVSGYDDGTIGVTNNVKRDEISALLVRMK